MVPGHRKCLFPHDAISIQKNRLSNREFIILPDNPSLSCERLTNGGPFSQNDSNHIDGNHS